jgi:acetolactate synthase-1/2/3 large subunit
MTGGAALATILKECRVDFFSYVSGGMGPSFYKEIENAGVRMILCRNEKAASNMADGYSRVARKASVCYSQHSAAAAILVSMLYEPMFSHSPVVALTGSVPTSDKDRWYYQECYEMPYFESTCKFNVDVTDVSGIVEYVRTAIQIAISGCHGPTHVNIHTDMSERTEEMPEIYGDKTFYR